MMQILKELKLNILLGQQSGYTKFPCFICLWDSRAEQEHWVRRNWPLRENMEPGKQNIVQNSLVARDKIILPPLHIKLGIMKQFVKSLDKNGNCFSYICEKFPQLTMEKFKAGIFDGLQIRQLTNDTQFTNSMTELELKAWTAFVSVMQNFLGNKKSENSIELVENPLLQLKNMACNMSIKLHFLHSHLDRFPENLGDMSEEQESACVKTYASWKSAIRISYKRARVNTMGDVTTEKSGTGALYRAETEKRNLKDGERSRLCKKTDDADGK
ncbi:hypothetical protein EVAR_99750_1 [Eumeta japonica]|uniref:Uncharacterized protein n=1 Tax=Eumeta variegata TaxID=151549 RepID=A0A4C1T0B2_EUMVA|nr:hypothetical protein EVAR_99750_1 [Eumeta japonica]